MTMTPRLTKLMLTSHITFSVGWFGAVAVFLALAITGLTSPNTQLARSAYLAMELSTWFVIVPFCLASLITGIIQSIGTKWGLFKHYWIIIKLFLTLASTILLMLHMKPISYLAGVAADTSFSTVLLPGLRVQIIADAGAALLLLLSIITISVYKPWGKTKFGLRNQQPKLAENKSQAKKSTGFYVLMGLISLIILFIVMHLLGGGMGKH